MCGIVAILNVKEQTHELREQALKMSQKIRHRGPDWIGWSAIVRARQEAGAGCEWRDL